jgi:Ca2+-binding RTX toxin-like protein
MTNVIFTTNSGGPGNDTLGVRANYDNGSDTLTVDNVVRGLGGDDSVASVLLPIVVGDQEFRFAITVDGGEGNDGVTGYNATDTLIGGGGDDSVGGVSGSTMSGGSGIDTLALFLASTSTPFAGNFNLNYAAQAAGPVTLADGSTISGFEKFFIQSGIGNDTFDLSGDANALDSNFTGNDGDDTLIVNAATQGNIVFLGGLGLDRVVADLSAVTGTVELATTGTGGVLTAPGLTVGSNDIDAFTVISGSGNDLLAGGSSADTLAGGAGDDTLDGGGGSDTADYSRATGSGVTVILGLDGPQAVSATEGSDTIVAMENLIGSAQNDTLTGNASANRIDGRSGADAMAGGDASDVYVVDTIGDTISEGLNQGLDTIETALANFSLFFIANIERLTFTGAGNFVGRGNGLDNRIQGGLGNDRFVADQGGADRYFGDAGVADTMDFRLSATGAIVNLTTGVHGGAALGDLFSSIEYFYGSNTADDNLTGDAFNNRFDGYGGGDTLLGLGGSDTLNGGDGDDEISGGALLDFLAGNAGADDFNYAAASDSGPTSGGRDRILDFQAGLDDIDVSAIDADTSTGADDAFTAFIGAAAFTAAGQIRAFQSGANTVIEFNTTGVSGAEMQIQLNTFTAATLSFGDFIG